jgi:hypothetical protein
LGSPCFAFNSLRSAIISFLGDEGRFIINLCPLIGLQMNSGRNHSCLPINLVSGFGVYFFNNNWQSGLPGGFFTLPLYVLGLRSVGAIQLPNLNDIIFVCHSFRPWDSAPVFCCLGRPLLHLWDWGLLCAVGNCAWALINFELHMSALSATLSILSLRCFMGLHWVCVEWLQPRFILGVCPLTWATHR